MSLFDLFKKKIEKGNVKYLYTEQELDQYESYIEDKLGEYNIVFHEIVSTNVHIDVIIVPPTEKSPFYKLVTMGMGAYRMNVPKELVNYKLEYSELIIYLPGDWNIQSSEEKNYWPIRLLKELARIPIINNTWLGFGHTIHGNAEKTTFAEDTGFNSFVLLNGCDLIYENLNLQLNSGKKINFYQLFPLYQEELEFKQKESLNALLDLFSDEDVNPIINIKRKNYCRKN